MSLEQCEQDQFASLYGLRDNSKGLSTVEGSGKSNNRHQIEGLLLSPISSGVTDDRSMEARKEQGSKIAEV